jgi:hypothetical protein
MKYLFYEIMMDIENAWVNFTYNMMQRHSDVQEYSKFKKWNNRCAKAIKIYRKTIYKCYSIQTKEKA